MAQNENENENEEVEANSRKIVVICSDRQTLQDIKLLIKD